MVSTANNDEELNVKTSDKTPRVTRNVLLLTIGFATFLSLVLLFGCAYFSLRCQVQQLRADVDQLKAVYSLQSVGSGLRREASSPGRSRSKRDDAFNESAANRNATSESRGDNEYDDDDGGSGEVTDRDSQYPGIWMGTYSRVPVSRLIHKLYYINVSLCQ